MTVDCGNLTDPANGSVNHTAGTTLGQTATYSCYTGYNLVGDSTRTCQASANWSRNAPTCQGMLLHSVYLGSFHGGSETLLRPFLDQNDDASQLLDDRLPYVGISLSTSHFVNSHFVNSRFVNIDQMGIDKMRIDKVGS